jgi:hypothetical protein
MVCPREQCNDNMHNRVDNVFFILRLLWMKRGRWLIFCGSDFMLLNFIMKLTLKLNIKHKYNKK